MTLPRSGRGGARTGTVGKSYANRSDLNGAKMPQAHYTGQAYGVATQQQQAQAAVPVGSPSVATAPVDPQSAASQWADSVSTAHLPGLMDPTARPQEPLTAGLSQGPGAGPDSLPIAGDQDAIMKLRALYQQTGYPHLARLITAYEMGKVQ